MTYSYVVTAMAYVDLMSCKIMK